MNITLLLLIDVNTHSKKREKRRNLLFRFYMLNERKQKKHYHLYNSNCTTEMKKIDIEYLFIVILDDLIAHDRNANIA